MPKLRVCTICDGHECLPDFIICAECRKLSHYEYTALRTFRRIERLLMELKAQQLKEQQSQ